MTTRPQRRNYQGLANYDCLEIVMLQWEMDEKKKKTSSMRQNLGIRCKAKSSYVNQVITTGGRHAEACWTAGAFRTGCHAAGHSSDMPKPAEDPSGRWACMVVDEGSAGCRADSSGEAGGRGDPRASRPGYRRHRSRCRCWVLARSSRPGKSKLEKIPIYTAKGYLCALKHLPESSSCPPPW